MPGTKGREVKVITHSQSFVPNYLEITSVTAVITAIPVFWVGKRQMGVNAVILCVHLLQVISGGNFPPLFYIHVPDG